MLVIGFLIFGEIFVDKSSPAKDDKAVGVVFRSRYSP